MATITTTPTTATRIIVTAIIRTSASSRMSTAPAAVTTITTTRITVTIPIMAMASAEAGDWRELPLFLWLSPAFPVGSFAYSHGLEWAVEAGDVVDAGSLGEWLADLAAFGAPRMDAVLFAVAHRAAEIADWRVVERNQRAVGRPRRLGRAAAGDDRAGRRVPPRGARRVGLRGAGPRSLAPATRSPTRSRSPRPPRAMAWRANARRRRSSSPCSPIWSPPRFA